MEDEGRKTKDEMATRGKGFFFRRSSAHAARMTSSVSCSPSFVLRPSSS